jgi:hypothetical protein
VLHVCDATNMDWPARARQQDTFYTRHPLSRGPGPGGTAARGVGAQNRYDTGIRFCGSTNGSAVTVALRGPHSLATFTVVPDTASGVGSQQ